MVKNGGCSGDAGYLGGIQKRTDHKHRKDVSCFIVKSPGARKILDADRAAKDRENQSQHSAKVEHPFRYIKQVFSYGQICYRGLAKNINRLDLLATFTNLVIGEKYLLT